MISSVIDWTQIVGDLIGIVPAMLAAWFAYRIHRSIRTPSGTPLGELAEYAHDTTIANNLMLSKANGPTQPLSRDKAHEAASEPPRMPETPPTLGG